MNVRRAVAFFLVLSFSLYWLAASCAPEEQSINQLIRKVAELRNAGKYREAIPLAEQALALSEKQSGPDSAAAAASLAWLGFLHYCLGDYTHAETLYQRALKIREKVSGPEHMETARILNNLADLYRKRYDYGRAASLYERAMRIYDRVFGPDHLETAVNMDRSFHFYLNRGDFARAASIQERALRIYEKVKGPEDSATAAKLSILAGLYSTMGDDLRAGPLYERVLKIYEHQYGPEHPMTVNLISNLGIHYYRTGDNGRAQSFCERALKLYEKLYGPENVTMVESLRVLAAIHQDMGDLPAARALYEQILKIREKALGPEHSDTVSSLIELALLYYREGSSELAAPLYERALKWREKIFDPGLPYTEEALRNLCYLQLEKGDFARAAVNAQTCDGVAEKKLARILSFSSERQRLAFQKKTHPYDLFCTLGLASDCALAVLRHKGVVLDSLLQDMRIASASEDPVMAGLVEKLRTMKNQMAQLMIETQKDTGESRLTKVRDERERLEREIEATERRLARNATGLGRTRKSLSVSVYGVKRALPEDAVLVEYMKYRHYLGKSAWETRYGAVVIPPKGDPAWVPLGKATDIDEAIRKLQRLFGVAGAKRGLLIAAGTPAGSDEVTSATLRELCDRVWTPVEASLPESVKTLVLSPDGSLCFVPFAALLRKDDRFLCERYLVRTVSSGRDFLEEGEPGKTTVFAIFGNPDFGAAIRKEKLVGRRGSSPGLSTRDISSIEFSPLPGTALECTKLEALAKGRKYQVDVCTGSRASEPALRSVHSPWVLHLATHGFFLTPEQAAHKASGKLSLRDQPGNSEMNGKVSNPMLRSGIALSGANTTLACWKRGETPDTGSDGLIFAEEVGTLDLNGTWLVVLSACDTGLGDVLEGEGILGLRRSFVQSGAKNLMMTLWSISDKATVRFIEEFYAAACDSQDASKALSIVQRDMLVKLRKEKGLREAVYCAAPFVLTFQGMP